MIQRGILQGEGVSRVARESFVRALAGEHNRHSFASEAGDKVERDARRPDDGLVLMPDQMRQRAEEILLADQHLMVTRMDVV